MGGGRSHGSPTPPAGLRRFRRAALVTAILALAAAAPARADEYVDITPTGFEPPSVKLDPGEAVHFRNRTGQPQRVAAEDGTFDSAAIPPEGGFSFALSVPGLHAYLANPPFVGAIDVRTKKLAGPPFEPANVHIPDVPFPEAPDDDIEVHPVFGLPVSRSEILVAFTPTATVADANAALANADVAILGGLPQLGLLLVEAPQRFYGDASFVEWGHEFSGLEEALESLRADPAIETAAMSPLMSPKAVPRTPEDVLQQLPNCTNGCGWYWGVVAPGGGGPFGEGGNWGLEASRVPQLWNLNDAVRRRNGSVGTGVVDVGFFGAHEDLSRLSLPQLCRAHPKFAAVKMCTKDPGKSHGNSAAGIIGAEFENLRNDRSIGVSGINPFTAMTGVPAAVQNTPPKLSSTLAVTDMLLDEAAARNLRVLNYSIGPALEVRPFDPSDGNSPMWPGEWWDDHGTRTCGPGDDDDGDSGSNEWCTWNNDDKWLEERTEMGETIRRVAERAAALPKPVMIVAAAGNESVDFCADTEPRPCRDFVGPPTRVEARNATDWGWAARNWRGDPSANPILLVEALGDYATGQASLARAAYSNVEGDISAPGERGAAPTTVGPDRYDFFAGTSMATPFVTGVVGYMLAYNPDLSIADVRKHLLRWARDDVQGHVKPRLDAYASVLSLPGAAKDLADVNDVSADGNRRVVLDADNKFVREDRSGPARDQKVDMRDFRRLRDAWLETCLYKAASGCPGAAGIRLDENPATPDEHPKKDLNGDGCVSSRPAVPGNTVVDLGCPTSEADYPRLDLNGDGRVGRDAAVKVPLKADGSPAADPAQAASMTDLEVLTSQWTGPTDGSDWKPADLQQLMTSGDLELHADELIAAGAREVEFEVRSLSLGVDAPVARLKAGKNEVVVTAPVADAGSAVLVKASAQLGADTIEATPEQVQLRPGEDIRIDVCQGLRLKASTTALPADGVSKTKITATVRKCKPTDVVVGKTVEFAVEPATATFSAPSATTGVSGEASVDLTAGTTPAEYTVKATAELAEGRIAKAQLKLNATPKYKIAYVWRQETVSWNETGSTRPSVFPGVGWPNPPLAGQHDCTVQGTVDYCVDSFSIGPDTADPSEGLERKGVLSGAAGSFVLDEEVLKSRNRSSAMWTLSDPDGSNVRLGSKTSQWGVLNPKQFQGKAMPPELHTEETTDGVKLFGLSAIAKLGYAHYLFAASQSGASQPDEVHDAIGELLLVPRSDGSALKYGRDVKRPILFRRKDDGSFDPYVFCGSERRDRTTEPGYFVPRDSEYVPGAVDLGRKKDYSPGDHPMPVGPGHVTLSFAFAAVAVEGTATPTVTLPDCSQNKPPSADFKFEAPELAEGRVVQFTDLSTDPENNVISSRWEFGDGSTGSDSGSCTQTAAQDPCHFFGDNGNFTVTLTVTDGGGLSASTSKQVRIDNLPPTATLNDQTVQAATEQRVKFGLVDPGAEDKKKLKWKLSSDTGVFPTLEGEDEAGNQTAVFAAPGLPVGEHPVTLTVTDKDGDSDTAPAQITVLGEIPPPPPPPGPFVTCDPNVSLDAQEQEFLALVNLYRIQNGLSPLLGISPTLSKAAERHALDMAENGFMEHTGSDGSNPFGRATDAGYPGSKVSENLASDLETALEAMLGWKSSQTGHNENMLNPDWRAIGMAREFGSGHWRWATSYGNELDCPPAAPSPPPPPAIVGADTAPALAADGSTQTWIGAGSETSDASTSLSAAASVVFIEGPATTPTRSSATPRAPPAAATAAEDDPPALEEPPTPALVVSNDEPFVTKPVTLTNRSRDANGTAIAATIDFGDGSPAATLGPDESVVHAFANPYYHAVELTATDAATVERSVRRSFYVRTLPEPYVRWLGPASGVRGHQVTFRGSAHDWDTGLPLVGVALKFRLGSFWNPETVIGSATTDADGVATLTTTLDLPGSPYYYARVDFDGNADYSATYSWPPQPFTVIENTVPIADAGGPYVSGEGADLFLDGSLSRDPDYGDGIVAAEWDLNNDGTYGELAGLLPRPLGWDEVQVLVCGGPCLRDHPYTVRLKVTDGREDSATDFATVTFTGDFALLLTGEPLTLVPGASNTFAVTVVSAGNFTDPVTLSVDGLPAGVTAEFSQNPVTPPGVSNLTITATSSAPNGDFPIVVTGTSGAITHTISNEVRVTFGLIPICTASVTGTVTDLETGAPIAGADVVVGFYQRTKTDESGRFVVHNLGLGYNNAPLNYSLYAEKNGYWTSQYEQFVAACGPAARRDAKIMVQRNGPISGRVVEGVRTNPDDPFEVARTDVAIEGATARDQAGGVLTTDASGDYAGGFRLAYNNTPNDTYATAAADGFWPQSKRVLLEEGVSKTLDFELVERCSGVYVGGRLVDAITKVPLRIANVPIEFYGTAYKSTTTNEDGAFGFNSTEPLGHNNTPATYAVRTAAGGHSAWVRISECDERVIVDIPVQPPPPPPPPPPVGNVEGFVYDEETAEPVEGASVLGVRTDATGHYLAENIGARPISVTASKSGYYDGSAGGTVEADKTVRIDVRILRKKYATSNGKVTDSVTGAPIPSAYVEGTCFYPVYRVCTYTDREGSYRQERVEVGYRNAALPLTLRASHPSYWPQSKSTVLEGDATSTVDFELLKKCKPAKLVGKVVNAVTQEPIPNAEVSARANYVYTDAAGRFTLFVEPGAGNTPLDVNITASAPGFFSQTKKVRVFCGANIVVDFGTQQTNLGVIVGTVTNADTALPMKDVFLGSEFGGSDTTDEDGNYRLEGVPLGDGNADKAWAVHALPAGFKPQTKTVVARASVEVRADFSFSAFTNHAPTVADQSVSLNEDAYPGPAITLTGADEDGDALEYSVMSYPAHGDLSGEPPDVTYRPDAHYNGPDFFTFIANDGEQNSALATVSLSVTPVNDAPAAVDDWLTAVENTPLSIPAGDLLANDVDADGDTLTIAEVQEGFYARGTVVLDGTTVVYTPAPNWAGPASFTYRVRDPSGASAWAGVHIDVTNVPGPPRCEDDTFGLYEDDSTGERTIACRDDEDDPRTHAVVAAPSHGTVNMGDDGKFTYRPSLNYNGSDSFTFKATDASGDSNVATANLIVVPVNDKPTADPGLATMKNNDPPLAIDLGALVADVETADADFVYTIESQPSLGTVGGPGPVVTFTPNPGASGYDYFLFSVTDRGDPDACAAGPFCRAREKVFGYVELTIEAAPAEAPSCQNASVSTAEDTRLNAAVSCTDPLGAQLAHSVVDGPAHGTLSLAAGGTFEYVPAPNFHGVDGFSYRASSGALASNTAMVSITVTPVNDAPAAADDSYALDEDVALEQAAPGVLANDADVDGDALSPLLVSGPAHGTLALRADGSFRYEPAANYNGPDAFTYRARDGALESTPATVSLTVRPVQDPVSCTSPSFTTAEDTELVASVSCSGDGIAAYELLTAPEHGTLQLEPGGASRYRPGANYNGPDSFEFRAVAGAATSSAVATITVTPVNDAPAAAEDAFAIAEDGVLEVAAPGVLGNDSDVEADSLTATVVAAPTHGTLTLRPNGSLTYRPAADFNGADAFTYGASDGSASSQPARVSITVSPVNDAPVATLEPAGPLDEGGAAITLRAVATDADGDSLQYAWSTDLGTLVPAGDRAELRAGDGPASAHVRVTVTDAAVGVAAERTIEVRNVPPTAAAGPDATQYWGLPVDFAGGASDPSPADIAAGLGARWRFADGGEADGLTATHTYAAPGSYPAALSVADKDGGEGVDERLVVVRKRETRLEYAGSPTSEPGTVTLSARLADAVVAGPLAGRTVTFAIDGRTLTAVTDAAGLAAATTSLPEPASYPVRVEFAGDSHYLSSSAETQLRTVRQAVIVDGVRCSIVGTEGPDVLVGTKGDDVICGLGGNDRIDGLAGNDRAYGGPGADVVVGGPGRDLLRGSAGRDDVRGGAGNDNIDGQLGNDRVDGGAGNDIVNGYQGNDVLLGGAGNDKLGGTAGNDRLFGGGGNDFLSGGGGNDQLRGQAGADALRGGSGSDRAFGGPGDDDIGAGAGANNVLRGEAGDDELDAINGARDDVDGGPGRDRALVDGFLDLVRLAEDILRR